MVLPRASSRLSASSGQDVVWHQVSSDNSSTAESRSKSPPSLSCVPLDDRSFTCFYPGPQVFRI